MLRLPQAPGPAASGKPLPCLFPYAPRYRAPQSKNQPESSTRKRLPHGRGRGGEEELALARLLPLSVKEESPSPVPLSPVFPFSPFHIPPPYLLIYSEKTQSNRKSNIQESVLNFKTWKISPFGMPSGIVRLPIRHAQRGYPMTCVVEAGSQLDCAGGIKGLAEWPTPPRCSGFCGRMFY